MTRPTKALVLGGGPAGLTAARLLAESRKFAEGGVALVEAASEVGGWIASERRAGSGALFERGPHSMRLRTTGSGPRTARVLEEVGLASRALAASSAAADRYVYVSGGRGLVRLPNSALGLLLEPMTRWLPLEALREVARFDSRAGRERLRREHQRQRDAHGGSQDVSVRDFFADRFSERTANEIVAAIVAGVFAGDAAKLSMSSCFPDLAVRATNGSLVADVALNRTKPATTPVTNALTTAASVSFPDGMAELVRALRAAAERAGVRLSTGSAAGAGELARDPGTGEWVLRGERYSHVASTIPVRGLRAALGADAPPSLAALEAALGRVDVAVVNLHYADERPSVRAFGHLVPAAGVQRETGALGVLYDSIAFPAQQPRSLLDAGGSVVSVMLGGAHASWIAREPRDALIYHAAAVARHQAGFTREPVDALAALHEDCIPQYAVGHPRLAANAKRDLFARNLLLLGTGVSGVGLSDALGRTAREVELWLVHAVAA